MAPDFKAKDYIEAITPYKQGKSETGKEQGEVIKLSSNENALKTSEKAALAYQNYSGKLERYADGGCKNLRNAIAKKYKIDADRIVCGSGSDEIISLLVQAFAGQGDEIIYSEYGFLMYPISAQRFGAKAVAAKEADLKTNVDNILGLVNNRTKMIFIANPNNPTGSHIDKADLEKLINNTPKNVIIVLDLAYAEFVDLDDSEYCDVINLVEKNENVVMTRTFSKIHGLASLRLGWSYSCSYIADILNKTRGPFNVTGAAMEAGIAAILDDEFIAKSVAYNNKWLEILKNEFAALNIKTYPSVANFILVDFEATENCQKVNEFLIDNGVILREMSSYNLPNCLRMTIGTKSENLKVIELFKQFQNNN